MRQEVKSGVVEKWSRELFISETFNSEPVLAKHLYPKPETQKPSDFILGHFVESL
ncbi:MAG: hypothetical protein ACFB2X_24105 [Rivularia sp. (in: cyanobacteria)]